MGGEETGWEGRLKTGPPVVTKPSYATVMSDDQHVTLRCKILMDLPTIGAGSTDGVPELGSG